MNIPLSSKVSRAIILCLCVLPCTITLVEPTYASFSQGTTDGVLYPFCAQVSSDVLAPALKKHFGLSGLKLHWAFLRKYTMDGRIEFPVRILYFLALFHVVSVLCACTHVQMQFQIQHKIQHVILIKV